MLRFPLSVAALLLLTLPAIAQDYKVAPLAEAPPADAISPEIAALLQTTGFKVVKGESRTIAEVWLAKEWPIQEKKNVSGEVIYPFRPGQLIGVVRYPRKSNDFRDQDVPAGVYTLRYGQQPIDGAHVGTSPTRDFLCLLPADKDRQPGILDYPALIAASKQTAESNHPAILSLQRQSQDAKEKLAIRHDEEKDWWIVRFTGQTKLGDKLADQAVEAVVVGVAAE
jgi:hypothetical protein